MSVLRLAAAVDTDALLQTVWTGALAGIGVCLIFAVTILGATRSSDMRREDRHAAATSYGLLAVLGVLASLAMVAYGVVLITTK